VGFKIPLATRTGIIERLRAVVESICDNPGQLTDKARAARQRVMDLFTWSAKAQQITEVYGWVRRLRSERPDHFDFRDTG
jgi:glycosyltransferase involved in cell wall biosynthesis